MECNCWNPQRHTHEDHDTDCKAYRTGDVSLDLCWSCYGCGAAEFLIKWQPDRNDLHYELEDERFEAVVEAWNTEKAYGFIRFSNSGVRMFTHKNDTIQRINLTPGSLVLAGIGRDSTDRPRAQRVEVVKQL